MLCFLQDLQDTCSTLSSVQCTFSAQGMGSLMHQEQAFLPVAQGLLACHCAAQLSIQPSVEWLASLEMCRQHLAAIAQHPLLSNLLTSAVQSCQAALSSHSAAAGCGPTLFLLPAARGVSICNSVDRS